MKVASDLASDRGGYGIRLVERYATSWGVEVRGERKAVWVELPATLET